MGGILRKFSQLELYEIKMARVENNRIKYLNSKSRESYFKQDHLVIISVNNTQIYSAKFARPWYMCIYIKKVNSPYY